MCLRDVDLFVHRRRATHADRIVHTRRTNTAHALVLAATIACVRAHHRRWTSRERATNVARRRGVTLY